MRKLALLSGLVVAGVALAQASRSNTLQIQNVTGYETHVDYTLDGGCNLRHTATGTYDDGQTVSLQSSPVTLRGVDCNTMRERSRRGILTPLRLGDGGTP